jgi:hypothetical protein
VIIKNNFIIICICIYFLGGCQTAQVPLAKTETRGDLEKAIGSVAGAMRGAELSEEEMKDLTHQLRKDPEAQQAIKSISDSMTGQNRIIKYSPVTGKRYAEHMTHDPETGAELVELKGEE